MLRIDVLTLFPEMFSSVLGASILRRAAEPVVDPAAPENPTRIRPPVVSYHLHDIRAHTMHRHQKVDAPPAGGGPGMVMQCQPVWDAVTAVEIQEPHRPATRVFLTPTGQPLTQPVAERLARQDRLLLICGHYEGIDQRVLDQLRENGGLEEISLGDYVLSGGELAAMVLMDAVVRLQPGALGDEISPHDDSFSPGTERLLEHPQYTRPRVWEGREIPPVLLSGNHAKICSWRREQSRERTRQRRPELLGLPALAALQVTYRESRSEDAPAIDHLLREAFGRAEEAELVAALRREDRLVVEAVAESHGQLVGMVAYTEVEIEDQRSIRGLLALAPLAVAPAFQKRGIGSQLLRLGNDLCRDAGARRLFVLGDPTFYRRFGFEPAGPLGFSCPWELGESFQTLALKAGPHDDFRGRLIYAPPFETL